MKMEGIRLYNKSIEERKKRKKYVVDPNGVNWCGNDKYTKRPEHNEIYQNMAKFCIYSPNKQQFRELIDGLIQEHELRKRIQKIKHYMINGVTSIQQFKDIEQCYKQHPNASLDQVSRYLKLQRLSRPKNANKRSIRRRHVMAPTGSKSAEWTEREKMDISKMEGFDTLGEGERKLCNRLKIKPSDYRNVQRTIGDVVARYGLMKQGKVSQQMHINIAIDGALDIKLGLVNPQHVHIDSRNV